MLKKIILPILAVLIFAGGAAAYLFSHYSYDDLAATTVLTATENEPAYAIRFTDPDGNPVAGVRCNVCSDTLCAMLVSDEDGVAHFAADFVPSKVQLLKAPEGFVLPAETEFPLSGEEETLIILSRE